MTRHRRTARPPGADKRAADTRRDLEQRRAEDRATHSITCLTVCPGWGCECWCHDCPEVAS